MAGVQSSLYLLVLSVNAAIAVWRGLADWPGELLWWGTLLISTSAATAAVIAGVGDPRGQPRPVVSPAG
jgi:hypothetical protein